MQLYFAPMEGVTSYLYRRIHAEMFPGADRYYAPFLAPDGSGRCRVNRLQDLLPENNRDINLVPQILCSRPEPFLALSRQLADMGYREVNLNAGCPSGTVVPKHKGAGMLSDLDALDAFFAEVFSHCSLSVSVKTRLGVTGTEEFPAILEIYNKYPLAELIIHARDRAGMYRSTPDAAAFVKAFSSSHNPVCYNGNLFTPFDLTALLSLTPGLQAAMVGRGAAANPALFRQLQGGPALNAEELREFLLRLESAFLEAGLSDHFILARLKELWYYLIYMFPGSRHGSKSINKAQTLADYHEALRALFAEGSFSPDGAFSG